MSPRTRDKNQKARHDLFHEIIIPTAPAADDDDDQDDDDDDEHDDDDDDDVNDDDDDGVVHILRPAALIKVLSAEDPKLSKVSSLKSGVDQNVAFHASPAV